MGLRKLLIAAVAIPVLGGALGTAAPAPVAETVTVNPSIRHQTMRGWGATHSFLRDLNYVSQATVDQMVDESVNDLGLTFLRIGFAVLVEPFNDNGSSDNINWDAFYDKSTIDRDIARGLGRFNALVQTNGEPASYLLNKDWEFSAPSWMNDGEFAENVTATLLYYRNQHGITINFSSIDNEPDRFDPYTPERQRSMIKVMGPKFQANGLPTKIALNEGINAESTWRYVSAMQGDSNVWPHVGLLNWHLYGTNDPHRALIRDFGISRGIPTAMTEFEAQIFHLMDDLTLGGVSYWTRYHTADRTAGSAGANSNYFGAPLDGTSFVRNNAYYQFRQFMHYVRPGAVRIEATSTSQALRAFAFERAGSRTVVLVNSSGTALDVNVQGLASGRHGVSQTIGQSYSELGVQDISSSMSVTVAGNGILTIYPAPANQAPTAVSWAASPSFLTLPASTISLSASAEDTERDSLSYTWSVKSAPVPVTLASPSTPATGASGLNAAGTYVFTVTIRDTAGHTVARDVTVRAYQGNQAPVIAEGHRYYKQEWIVPPENSATFGPLFISAHDIEGDPVTTSFSVVSQPSGGHASFNGSTVSGLTVPGTYTIRFTASDPTHTVTRDFIRRVVTSPPTTPGVPAGAGRRRPEGVPAVGTAVPRTTPSDSNRGSSAAAARTTSAPSLTGIKRAASLHTIIDRLQNGAEESLASGWRRIEVIDSDDDGIVDIVQIELTTGEIWTWRVERS